MWFYICLCAGHHADEHPNVPRALFFTKTHQPYWPNISASTLGRLAGRHSRTIIRVARKLGIKWGSPLSNENRLLICSALRRPRLSDEQKFYIANYCVPILVNKETHPSVISAKDRFLLRYVGNIFTKETVKDYPKTR